MSHCEEFGFKVGLLVLGRIDFFPNPMQDIEVVFCFTIYLFI